MSFSVSYWVIYNDNTVKKTTAVCFSALPTNDNKGIKMIRYLCPISKELDKDTLSFYLDFLTKTFTGREYSYKLIKVKKKKYIHVTVNCANWNKYHILVYLSAFRMVDECSEIIQELYNSRAEAFDTQFIKFQDIHKEVCDGKITLKKNGLHTLDCHGVAFYSEYGGTCKLSEYKPISYEIFKDRLENRKSDKVHGYLSPV